MKKIPTLFKRIYENHRVAGITPEVTEGMEWVLEGEGVATIKWDGSCCMIMGGTLYKRYDAKKGKNPPEGAIPCCDPDPVTGHWPHWVKVDENNPSDKWFVEALKSDYNRSSTEGLLSSSFPYTFEAIGPHFQGNPYRIEQDCLVLHGDNIVDVERTFEGIKKFLTAFEIEGLVFWKDGEAQCKIKRSDFGLEWPVKEKL